VLFALQNTLAGLTEACMNVEPLNSARQAIMEIDAAAIRGYQAFLFSCSTEYDNKPLKGKLFEGYVRARQLGGDEARIALVSPTAIPGRIEAEMRRDFDIGESIKVFGKDDLGDLARALDDWLG